MNPILHPGHGAPPSRITLRRSGRRLPLLEQRPLRKAGYGVRGTAHTAWSSVAMFVPVVKVGDVGVSVDERFVSVTV